jgi:hypothetical protein
MTRVARLAVAGMATMLALAACASRSERISGELTDMGLSPDLSACLGQRLADDLSDEQLRALGRAVEAYRGEGNGDGGGRGLSLAGLARAAGEIEDLQSVGVVTRAGVACGLS